MTARDKKNRNVYLTLFACLICLIFTLVIQGFATYTLYHNALSFEERYLRESVDNTIYYIDSSRKIIEEAQAGATNPLSQEDIRKKLEEKLREHFYANASPHSYMWINEVLDFNGGDDYGVRLIHPNLKNREGEYLSTKTQDAAGGTPYLTELEGVKANGAILFSYYFKELKGNEQTEKLTYSRLYPDYNWIICMGIPYDAVWGEVLLNRKSTLMVLVFGYLVTLGGILYLLLHINRLTKQEREENMYNDF